MIVVYLSRNLTGLTNGADAFEVEGQTVGECLNDLVSIVPRVRNELFSFSGDRLQERIQVRVNSKTIDPKDRLTKNIKDGDQIDISLRGR